jgi:hypothetical protein
MMSDPLKAVSNVSQLSSESARDHPHMPAFRQIRATLLRILRVYPRSGRGVEAIRRPVDVSAVLRDGEPVAPRFMEPRRGGGIDSEATVGG